MMSVSFKFRVCENVVLWRLDNLHLVELVFDDDSCVGDETNKEGVVTKEPWDFINQAIFSSRNANGEWEVDLPSLFSIIVRVRPDRERGTSFMNFGIVHLNGVIWMVRWDVDVQMRESCYHINGNQYGFFYYLNYLRSCSRKCVWGWDVDSAGLTKIIASNAPWALLDSCASE